MGEAVREAVGFVRQDPMVIVGIICICISQLFALRIHAKMKEIGDTSYALFKPINDALWKLPIAYMRVRAQQKWSPWPVYLAAAFLGLGLVLLVAGLLRF